VIDFLWCRCGQCGGVSKIRLFTNIIVLNEHEVIIRYLKTQFWYDRFEVNYNISNNYVETIIFYEPGVK